MDNTFIPSNLNCFAHEDECLNTAVMLWLSSRGRSSRNHNWKGSGQVAKEMKVLGASHYGPTGFKVPVKLCLCLRYTNRMKLFPESLYFNGHHFILMYNDKNYVFSFMCSVWGWYQTSDPCLRESSLIERKKLQEIFCLGQEWSTASLFHIKNAFRQCPVCTKIYEDDIVHILLLFCTSQQQLNKKRIIAIQDTHLSYIIIIPVISL